MSSVIIYEKRDKVAYITINRPEVYNALNNETKHELFLAIKDYSKDDSLRCAVLTGAGKNAFCAGQDFTISSPTKLRNGLTHSCHSMMKSEGLRNR